MYYSIFEWSCGLRISLLIVSTITIFDLKLKSNRKFHSIKIRRVLWSFISPTSYFFPLRLCRCSNSIDDLFFYLPIYRTGWERERNFSSRYRQPVSSCMHPTRNERDVKLQFQPASLPLVERVNHFSLMR